MSRGLPKLHRQRILIGGLVAGTLIGGVAAVGAAMAGESTTKAAAGAPTVSCPAVAGQLPAIPASAQAEVDRNLALLDTQIAEANTRLANTVGQGGVNFVDNAILGPLADKRASTLDRIAIAIGRTAERPEGLDELAACELAGDDAPAKAGAPAEEDAPAKAGTPAEEDAPAADVGTISCPAVPDLGDVPAASQAEVDRNLALLDTQIAEANTRLANTVGQGGVNFVDNAILGPLADKRASTLDRIRIAIERQGGTAPANLAALANCTVA